MERTAARELGVLCATCAPNRCKLHLYGVRNKNAANKNRILKFGVLFLVMATMRGGPCSYLSSQGTWVHIHSSAGGAIDSETNRQCDTWMNSS